VYTLARIDDLKVGLEVLVHTQEPKRLSINSGCIAFEIIENNDVDIFPAKDI